MALLQCKFLSKALFNNTDVTIFIPSMLYEQIRLGQGYPYDPRNRYQVLYLLHGHSGDNQDWVSRTNIINYAEERQLAVVMPSASDSFYCNMAHGKAFWTYISEELPLFIRSMFPVSTEREDTFVAGLSMGGFGAMKLALCHPENFSAVISLSGVLDTIHFNDELKSFIEPTYRNVFGDEPISGTENDLIHMLEYNVKSGIKLPGIYQACGTADFLLEANRSFYDKARSLPTEVIYEEETGAGHEWAFWDKYILKALEWLPLKRGPVFEKDIENLQAKS